MANVVQLRFEDFMDRKEFEAGIIKRTRLLRERHGVNQETMAELLGIQGGTYRKYEVRSPLPDYLKPRFCMIVQSDMEYLISGNRQTKPRVGAQPAPKLTAIRA